MTRSTQACFLAADRQCTELPLLRLPRLDFQTPQNPSASACLRVRHRGDGRLPRASLGGRLPRPSKWRKDRSAFRRTE